MSRHYFGTDGIRGQVGDEPMTVDFALRLASAAAKVLAPRGGSALIGKDTRLSGYMFESALEAGFVAAGMDALLLGPLPTPGIAYLTQRFGADVGVVISASHNPFFDNGIKFFDANGTKLSDEVEAEIERYLAQPAMTRESSSLGRAKRVDSSRVKYQEFCASTLPAGLDLAGLKIAIDCAHGAAYKVAPRILSELEAEIIPIGCSPNGKNINDGCGALHPELLQTTVKGVGADAGIALDGDGDRVVMVDSDGRLVDGDQILYVVARARHRDSVLRGPVVGTVMSNLGLERALVADGIDFRRAKVGDRYVLAMLQEMGGTIGGETSGHVICLDKTTTGDGIITALQVLAIIKQSGMSLADLTAGMTKYPQKMVNVRVSQKIDPEASTEVQQGVRAVESELGDRGRVVLRPSGTEPVIRVMVEGQDGPEVERLAQQLAEVVKEAAEA